MFVRTASPFHEGDELLTGIGYFAILGCIAFMAAQIRLFVVQMQSIDGGIALVVALFALGVGALWLGRSKPVVIPLY